MVKSDFYKMVGELREYAFKSTDSRLLINLILEESEDDRPLKCRFGHWLENGGTIYLRDRVAETVKCKFIQKYGNKNNKFFNAWAILDSAQAKI